MRTETLVRMAEQIAANNSSFDHDRAVSRIGEHLRSFWTPAMLDQLAAYDREHPGELDPRVTSALHTLVA